MYCRIHWKYHKGKRAKAQCYMEISNLTLPEPDTYKLYKMFSRFRTALGNLTYGDGF